MHINEAITRLLASVDMNALIPDGDLVKIRKVIGDFLSRNPKPRPLKFLGYQIADESGSICQGDIYYHTGPARELSSVLILTANEATDFLVQHAVKWGYLARPVFEEVIHEKPDGHIVDDSHDVPLSDGDYKLVDGAAWVSYKNIAIRISATDEGIGATFYALDHEGDDDIAYASALFSSAQEVIDQAILNCPVKPDDKATANYLEDLNRITDQVAEKFAKPEIKRE